MQKLNRPACKWCPNKVPAVSQISNFTIVPSLSATVCVRKAATRSNIQRPQYCCFVQHTSNGTLVVLVKLALHEPKHKVRLTDASLAQKYKFELENLGVH